MSKTVKTLPNPNIICLDIETTPDLVWVWRLWDTNAIEVEEDWGILCFAWKRLEEEEIHAVARPDFKKEYAADKDDDYKVVEALHKVLDDADIIIAHNGERFDIPKINARLLVHGFSPPSPFQSVDTLKMARKTFSFSSNKLNDLGKILGLGEKEKHHGFETWKGCMQGDKEAWKEMVSYNKRDVALLEDVYCALLPWVEGHPNMALLSNKMDACPRCGKDAMIRQGFKHTKTMTYQRWSCTNCGGWSRTRLSEKVEPKPRFVN